MKTLYYRIANLDVQVTIPDSWDQSILLSSCEPFAVTAATDTASDDMLRTVGEASDIAIHRPVGVVPDSRKNARLRSDIPLNEGRSAIAFTARKTLERPQGAELIDTFENEAGIGSAWAMPGGGWTLEVHFGDENVNRAVCNSDFSKIDFWINPECKRPVTAVSTLMRSCFAQRILYFDGISIHSSTVKYNGKGYLFLGKSGTGKSTHSRLWLKNFPGCTLLNDDNPLIRKTGGTWHVFGSPWSGKTNCYVNDSAPVNGIVRLAQAPENKFTKLSGVQAWVALFPSCSIIRQAQGLNSLLTASLNSLACEVPVAALDCLPDDDAALICKTNLP